jgi:hypothetical protein
MFRAELDEAFILVIEETFKRVTALGFRRRGALLRALSHGNAGLIQFQKSTRSSSDQILFTVNLAVVCGTLLEQELPPLEKVKSFDGHLRQRIGMFFPGRPDKWWEIKAGVDAGALAAEVAALIATEGAPYIVRFLDADQLIALWESGQSPGLTETQRFRYLEKLKSKRWKHELGWRVGRGQGGRAGLRRQCTNCRREGGHN